MAQERFGCDPQSGRPRPLWYAYRRRRVLLLALSAEHSLGAASAQQQALSRTARAARAEGIAWVVAYGERPANRSSGAQLRQMLGGLGVDLYVTSAAEGAAAEKGFHERGRSRREPALLSLASGGYARVRGVNRSTVEVDHVHAADGRLLGKLVLGMADRRKLV